MNLHPLKVTEFKLANAHIQNKVSIKSELIKGRMGSYLINNLVRMKSNFTFMKKFPFCYIPSRIHSLRDHSFNYAILSKMLFKVS